MDGTNLGRLLVKHGKMYNFNLSTKEEPASQKNPNENVVVDLDIDGLNGPIAKIVKEEEAKKRVWMENDECKIDCFETTNARADAIADIARKIKDSPASSSETNAAQIDSTPGVASSPQPMVNVGTTTFGTPVPGLGSTTVTTLGQPLKPQSDEKLAPTRTGASSASSNLNKTKIAQAAASAKK